MSILEFALAALVALVMFLAFVLSVIAIFLGSAKVQNDVKTLFTSIVMKLLYLFPWIR